MLVNINNPQLNDIQKSKESSFSNITDEDLANNENLSIKPSFPSSDGGEFDKLLPTQIGMYYDGGSARRMCLKDDLLYVADGLDGLEILNVSDPTNIVLEGNYTTGANIVDLEFYNDYLYIAHTSGLIWLNVSDPQAITLEGERSMHSTIQNFEIYDSNVFAALYTGGFGVYELSGGSAMYGGFTTYGVKQYLGNMFKAQLYLRIEECADPGWGDDYDQYYNSSIKIYDVDVKDNIAYVTGDGHTLALLNVSDVNDISFISASSSTGDNNRVVVDGDLAFVMNQDLIGGEWTFFNISDAPTLRQYQVYENATGDVVRYNDIVLTAQFDLGIRAYNFTWVEDPDYDGDGLDNDSEINIHGTDPKNSDSDEDGLSDYEEIIDHLTDPNDEDTDDDGLSDYEEINDSGTDPNDDDSDDDGLSDFDEVEEYYTDPLIFDGDNDGLSDGQEILTYGTSPHEFDSDDDLLLDGDEILIYGTNATNPDTDGDGVMDWVEIFELNTDPTNNDTDGDGIADWEDYLLGLNEDGEGNENKSLSSSQILLISTGFSIGGAIIIGIIAKKRSI